MGIYELALPQMTVLSPMIEDINNTLNITTNFTRNIYINLGQAASSIQHITDTQTQFNETMAEGEKKAGGLNDMLKKCASALPGIAEKAGEAFAMSDDIARSTAQLDMVNRAQGTSAELQEKIFQSAQRTGNAYQQTADMAVKLGNGTGKLFASNNELVDFTEQLNKAFAISGMDEEGAKGASEKLAEAFSAGKMDGGAMDVVMQNPVMAGNLQSYMEEVKGVEAGSLSQMADSGAIAAEDIKNSMLYAMDRTNEKFAAMPMTFGRISNQLANEGQQALRPLLQEIGRLAQSRGVQEMIASIGEVIREITPTVSQGIELLVNGAAWVLDHWAQLAPVVLTVAGAYGIYTAATGLHTIATQLLTVATAAANAAMLASPILWIVLLIMGVVAALLYGIQCVGGFKAAWLICVNGVLTGIETLQLFFMRMIMNIQGLFDNLVIGFLAVKNGILNLIGDLKVRGLMLLQNFINGVIDGINLLIGKLNTIPGVSLEAVSHVEFGTRAQAEEEAARQERSAQLQQKTSDALREQERRELNYNLKAAEIEQKRADREAGIQKAQEESARKKAEKEAEKSNYVFEQPAYSAETGAEAYNTSSAMTASGGGNALTGPVNSIDRNTSSIAGEIEGAGDDLTEMRNAAEEDIINRFTTAELTVNMGGITNQVNSGMDLDGIAGYLEDAINGVLMTAAEGVY